MYASAQISHEHVQYPTMTTEFERIRSLSTIFGKPTRCVSLGIGDDAALVEPPKDGQLVWTIDACVENIHFRSDMLSWNDVGYRSFMAAASDIAAMAASPIGTLCSVSIPKSATDDILWAIADGQNCAAKEIDTPIVGGNLSACDTVVLSTTVLGKSTHSPCRHGAKPGDVIALCGEVGIAAAGLMLLLRNPTHAASNRAESEALTAWRRPRAKISEGLLCERATSLIDVSDGLIQDADHIASASHVRMRISSESLITESLRSVAHVLDVDAKHLALSGGEDYALLGTFADARVPDGFIIIGVCERGSGVFIDGEPAQIDGHDHFR